MQLNCALKGQDRFSNLNHISKALLQVFRYDAIFLKDFIIENMIFEFMLFMDYDHVKLLIIGLLSLEKNKVLSKLHHGIMWKYLKHT